jgi:hypothetical protein
MCHDNGDVVCGFAVMRVVSFLSFAWAFLSNLSLVCSSHYLDDQSIFLVFPVRGLP